MAGLINKKTIFRAAALLAGGLLIALVWGACSLLPAVDTARVSINSGIPGLDGARAATAPDNVEALRLYVSAENMLPIVKEFSGGTVAVDVPAGNDRVFVLEAADANGDTTHVGTATTSLTAGQSKTLSINMIANPLANNPHPSEYPGAVLDGSSGKYYVPIVFADQGMSAKLFDDAMAYAVLLSTNEYNCHLVTIVTENEQTIIADMGTAIPMWIGGIIISYNLTWITGETPVASYPGTTYGIDDYGVSFDSGYWYGNNSATTLGGMIIEFEPN